jgi:serine/threonine-protein phosphatase 2A regulatory subunit B'
MWLMNLVIYSEFDANHNSTIHQMVYSAMKLFMEINPTLFDECTNEYTAIQEAAPQRLLERENVWKILEEKAASKRKSLDAAKEKKGVKNIDADVRAGSPMEITEDVATTDTKKQMDALHLQDDSHKKVVS